MNLDRLRDFENKTVLVFGDYMVDEYIDGDVKRISPEAPVPVLTIKNRFYHLGGAGNVIDNIVSLGGNVRAVGFIGEDEKGKWILKALQQLKVDTTYFILTSEDSTIVKTRVRSKNQQFIRIDDEIIIKLSENHFHFMQENLETICEDIDIIVISDYGKGTVSASAAQLLIQGAKERNIPVVVDPKGSDYSKYNHATLCTPNTNELQQVMGFSAVDEDVISEYGKKLRESLGLEHLILTRSEKGISVFSQDIVIKKDFPVVRQDVIDVTGAGDTVVAMLALCYATDYSIDDCCRLANHAASIVCSKSGSATVTISELLSSIHHNYELKQISLKNLDGLVKLLKSKGETIVFTNGCYDLLHAGHVFSFNQAKALGDVLIVGVNSDASIRRIKGEKRPIIDEKHRIQMLCALECIDYVVLMEEDTPVSLIRRIKPDIAVKGKDWENKDIPEKSIVEENGGRMRFIDIYHGLSTTNIIKKIKMLDQNEK